MARTLFSAQEEGWRIDSGQIGVFEAHPTVRVSVQREDKPQPYGSQRMFKVTMFIEAGEKTVGFAENEYSSLEALMDDFGIDDIDEVWEVLDK